MKITTTAPKIRVYFTSFSINLSCCFCTLHELSHRHSRTMCILFMYNGSKDAGSDYALIVASNRDEYYKRPSENMASWAEDPHVIGGRDLEADCNGGSWLAISPMRKKLGVLLNLPRTPKPNAKTRGKIVADFVKNESSVPDYIDTIKSYVQECNDFVFIGVTLNNLLPTIYTYSNTTDQLTAQTDTCLGFGNSLPETPLKKVEAGRHKLSEVCGRLNKAHMKQQLVSELMALLKSDERHLPDSELETRRPALSPQLSSIYVRIPEGGYGTRTHTLILITKTGHTDVIEVSMQPPIDVHNPVWTTTELQFDVKSHL